jgi:uncharacterized protein (TIGR03435 family)
MRCAVRLLPIAGALLGAVATVAAPQRPAFEVSSIKLSDPGTMSTGRHMEHGSFRSRESVFSLVALVFDLNPETVAGGPDWVRTQLYDIAAKGDSSAGPGQIKLMIQTLLEDRFHLKFHREDKMLAGYELTVDARKGKSPTPSKEGTPRDGMGSIQVDANGFGTRGASMKSVSRFLWWGVFQRPVVDRTGLDGIYDFELKYDDPNSSGDQYGSIFAAFQGIGLKLSAANVPVSVLHIDSVERPSEN